ncbi:hypothetical protein PFISCL1PPCAC_17605, partial [Pristionchus fissidentatus]
DIYTLHNLERVAALLVPLKFNTVEFIMLRNNHGDISAAFDSATLVSGLRAAGVEKIILDCYSYCRDLRTPSIWQTRRNYAVYSHDGFLLTLGYGGFSRVQIHEEAFDTCTRLCSKQFQALLSVHPTVASVVELVKKETPQPPPQSEEERNLEKRKREEKRMRRQQVEEREKDDERDEEIEVLREVLIDREEGLEQANRQRI